MVLSLTLKSLPLIGSIFLLLFFLLKVEKSFDREPQQNFVSGYGGMRCLLQIRPIILKPFFLLIRTFALIIFFNRYRTEKKYSPQDCVSLREHFAPRLFLQRFSFFDKNSGARFRMALKAPHSPVSVNPQKLGRKPEHQSFKKQSNFFG